MARTSNEFEPMYPVISQIVTKLNLKLGNTYEVVEVFEPLIKGIVEELFVQNMATSVKLACEIDECLKLQFVYDHVQSAMYALCLSIAGHETRGVGLSQALHYSLQSYSACNTAVFGPNVRVHNFPTILVLGMAETTYEIEIDPTQDAVVDRYRYLVRMVVLNTSALGSSSHFVSFHFSHVQKDTCVFIDNGRKRVVPLSHFFATLQQTDCFPVAVVLMKRTDHSTGINMDIDVITPSAVTHIINSSEDDSDHLPELQPNALDASIHSSEEFTQTRPKRKRVTKSVWTPSAAPKNRQNKQRQTKTKTTSQAVSFSSTMANCEDRFETKLKDIVSLSSLKESLKSYMTDMLADKLRRDMGFVQGIKRPVFVFLGNPGTGKTSIATIVAGETASKTLSVIDRARGATLLIDEAYTLMPRDSNRDFGLEAVEAIMGVIEGSEQTLDDRPAFIFTGYPIEMQRFLNSNAGLRQRITDMFNFDNYSFHELCSIYVLMAEKCGFNVTIDREQAVQMITGSFTEEICTKYNAGLSRELFAASKHSINNRVMLKIKDGMDATSMGRGDLMVIGELDFRYACDKVKLKLV